MRRVIVLTVLMACAAVAGCSTDSGENRATEMMDQILSDWAAKDAEGVAAIFGTEGTFTASSTKVLVGHEAGDYLSQYVPAWNIALNGDTVDNGDGSFTFPVIFAADLGAVEHVTWRLTVVDDQLVDLTEGIDSANGS